MIMLQLKNSLLYTKASSPLGRKQNAFFQAGFTLIEMIIVIMLVAILSVAVLPRLNPNTQFQQLLYADDLFSSVTYAKKMAVAMNCPVSVIISQGLPQLSMSNTCSMDTLASTGGSTISDPSRNLIVSWQNNYSASADATQNTTVSFIFDSRGKARSAVSPFNVIDITLPIAGENINIVGETGLIYFGGTSDYVINNNG